MAKTVLVVDDEPILCEVLREFLTGKGFHVTKAHDGDQALAEGALDYITKPFTLPSLQRALETVVSSLGASA